MRFFIFFMTIFSLGFAQENSIFFEKLLSDLQEEKWDEVVLSAQQVLQNDISNQERFAILDQLVSSYFRLGDFNKAKEKANELIYLGTLLNQPTALVDSFYKALKARVLFNRGAVHCDDPIENVPLGITYYKEAILLFQELGEVDFIQRMSIRLGKAYFLIGELHQSYKFIKGLKVQNIERRTFMHLLYLEAQVCLAKGDIKSAFIVAMQGKEIAISLHAAFDLVRFETFIEKLPNLER